jgi:hypothetical protein
MFNLKVVDGKTKSEWIWEIRIARGPCSANKKLHLLHEYNLKLNGFAEKKLTPVDKFWRDLYEELVAELQQDPEVIAAKELLKKRVR